VNRDQLALQLRGVLAEETPPNVGDRRIQAMVEVVLLVVDDLVWSRTGTYTPDPDGGDDGTFVPDTWRKRSDDLQVQLTRAQAFAAVLHDLDRCEHGRHEGDNCYGCEGPSRGNPVLELCDAMLEAKSHTHPLPTRTIGFDISGNPIVVPEAFKTMTDPDAWRTR
jgi:hypothetical protein